MEFPVKYRERNKGRMQEIKTGKNQGRLKEKETEGEEKRHEEN
jgi:hypothetical protein